ncbi:hypothetical protein KI688_001475 [Linnemannia hyalina]|uniref:Uncharacterized protein n=1 Tax=Linnemannia hyalina TaxID=64524 RepID=A0A9P7XUN9_9FUNG|nr:hypothetical protein KI688_001475 [Linnemannia hyalina]
MLKIAKFAKDMVDVTQAKVPEADAFTARDITTVIVQVMALRKEVVSYYNKLVIWKKGHKAAKESIKPVIPTLPTPASTPKNCPASV